MKRALAFLVAWVLSFSITMTVNSCIQIETAYKMLADEMTTVAISATRREKIVTGVCTFGGCPVATTATTLPPTTEDVKESLTTELVSETYTLTEQVTERNGYIGTFWITGYTAEEGFPEGSKTASGYGVRPGYCAMNADQRRSLGIRYGDQIYVDGLGTYTVMDSGCGWGVVDIWVYTNAEAYSITGNYDVYLI